MECLLFGGFETEISMNELIIIIVDIIMITIEYSAILTFISLVCSDINLSTVIGLVLAVIMIATSFYLIERVNEPQYYYSTVSEGDKIIEKSIMSENLRFPGEKKAKQYKNILYIMPAGQATMLLNKLSPDQDVENRRDYNNTILLLCSIRSHNNIYFIRNSYI